jgi:hypothetical protein
MGLIRTLLIIAVIYFSLRLISRFVFPFVARYFMKKASETLQEQMRSTQQGQKIYQEGEVTIRKKDQKDQAKGMDEGEYVDYEEV